ncbi:hypothetical protein AB0H43_09285 [Hamadaea sp. NPDC050747]|uniref:hypothetical protein n=1 Tax=Hamadaea sp. NPDC050747 TaxID=3155789 RepID=UPI0033DFE8FF
MGERGTGMGDGDRQGRRWRGGGGGCGTGGGYFIGFIGAAVYYIQQADGFWEGVVGVLKAMVWPAFLVYEVLKFVSA